ncbi:MAG: hypothetical protein QXK19_07245 [Nitrososphaerota archaeon]
MWGKANLTIIVYFISLCLLILITPPYGDPAVVLWTSKIMSITGFPYDPICSISKTVNGVNLQFCVRSPLYYMLLGFSGDYYKIFLIILVGLYFILQTSLTHSIGSSSTVYALMFPPIYLLFSRTYVDTLTAILSTTLLATWIKARTGNDRYYKILLFSAPLLLMLTRESSTALPFLLLIIFLMERNFKDKTLLIVFLGWAAGFSIYHLYITLSGGAYYSDFQPHIPSLEEVYRAFMTASTPILPWEISRQDLQTYLHLPEYVDWFTPAIIIVVHLLAVMVLVPLILSLTHIKDLHRVIIGWLIFGSLILIGLLFLKGDIDFFRHLSYLLPVIPLLIEKGLTEVKKYSRVGVGLIKTSYILLFALYLVRAIRLYTSGYAFDPCQYLLNRPEISSIDFFYKTACS